MTPEELNALADRVERLEGASDNELDVLCEVALFDPSENCIGCRANNAGTKVIYSYAARTAATYRAEDWTMDSLTTASALRARAALASENSNAE